MITIPSADIIRGVLDLMKIDIEPPQRMPIALAPADQRLRVAAARAEEGDDAVGELAEGHRVEGCVVEPVDDERVFAADPFETFACRAFRGGLGGMQGERRFEQSRPAMSSRRLVSPSMRSVKKSGSSAARARS
jgi:hypothetical protein